MPFKSFYLAADYHKDYETNRPDYCQFVINPKLKNYAKSLPPGLLARGDLRLVNLVKLYKEVSQ